MASFRGKANSGDRFIGLPCGCVVIVRGYELIVAAFNPAHIVESDFMFACKKVDGDFPAERMTDFVAANVYFECQAVEEPRANGIRWQ